MHRLTTRAAALLVALACLAWPMAQAWAAACPSSSAMRACAHCKRSKAVGAQSVKAPMPRCCVTKADEQPQAPASLTERPAPRLDAAPAPTVPAFAAAFRPLPTDDPEPRALPPRVLQRTHPLLR